MVKANIARIYYKAIGRQNMVDTISVDFMVDGKKYTHNIPNNGWNYQNPSLHFLCYLDLKPTDIEGTQHIIEENVMCPVVEGKGSYSIGSKPFEVGEYFLKEADWFNPEGEVWNSGENIAFGGMSVDPSTGNRAGVPVDGEE